jgi:RNA-directed DNA polymerase
MLANLVCVSLDETLQKIAKIAGLTYTRYADDMTFSGLLANRSAAAKLIGNVSREVSRYGFAINTQKTGIAKDGGRKIVTGLSVTEKTVRLPRSYKDELRKELYYLAKHGLEDHCGHIGYRNHLTYLLRLAGRIEYVAKVEPNLGTRLRATFERLVPDFLQLMKIV